MMAPRFAFLLLALPDGSWIHRLNSVRLSGAGHLKARLLNKSMFTGLDHLAIVIPDTEEALKIWRDRVGLKLLYSEVVQDGAVRLTHLDLGNTQLQLVEPLVAN